MRKRELTRDYLPPLILAVGLLIVGGIGTVLEAIVVDLTVTTWVRMRPELLGYLLLALAWGCGVGVIKQRLFLAIWNIAITPLVVWVQVSLLGKLPQIGAWLVILAAGIFFIIGLTVAWGFAAHTYRIPSSGDS